MKNRTLFFGVGIRARNFSQSAHDGREGRNGGNGRRRSAADILRAACTGVELLEERRLFSSVSGNVFSDLNLSGSRTGDDPPVAGMTIYDDLNNSGQYQAGDPSAVSAADGSYQINDVPLNTQQVIRAAPMTGWEESTGGGDTAMVTLTEETPDATNIDFGSWQPIQALDAPDLSLTEGQLYTGSVATIVESAGNNANPSNYSGTLDLDGTYELNFNFDADSNLILTPQNFPNLAAGTYTGNIAVAESSNGYSFRDSTQFTVDVAPAPISAEGANINANVGIPWSGEVATFTDPDPNAVASNYLATIDYGDDNELSVGTVSGNFAGGFAVTDNHTFPAEGQYSPVVTITDTTVDTGKTAAVTISATVSLAPISVDAPNMQLQEGQAGDGVIAMLTDSAGAYANGNYSGSFSIDGTSYNDLVFTSLGNGSYSVQCCDFPTLGVGSHSGTLQVTETGQLSSVFAGPVSFSINVADAPLTAAPANISAIAGVPYTGTVATFTDADPNAQASDYTATISYTDGSSAGTISSDGSGGWIVTSTMTFSTPGNSSPTVTITDNGGATTAVQSSASVSFQSLSLDSSLIYLEQGQSFSGTVGTLTDSAGSYSNVAQFSASLTWNGWIYGNLTFSPSGDGAWNIVSDSLAALPAGNYSGSLTVTASIGNQTFSTDPSDFTIDVIPPDLYATGVYINSTVNSPWGGTVANLADSDSFDLPSTYYTSATNYGDGTSNSSGQISTLSSGAWQVSDTHTFTAPGILSPTTSIIDTNNNTVATATSVATINLAALSLDSSSQWIDEGQSLGTLATLTDAAGIFSTGGYSGTLTLNGPSGQQSVDVGFVNDGNNDGVYLVEAQGTLTLSSGTYEAALTVSESAANVQSVGAYTYFVVNVADAPLTAQNVDMTAEDGNSWSGTVATFADADPNAVVSDYTTSIDFGDGTGSVAGTVSSDGNGNWIVTGTHTFPSVGSFSPVVTISDSGGSSTTATDTATVSPAPLDLDASSIELQEGQAVPTTIATLADSAGAGADGNYSGAVVIDGNSYPVSFVSDGNNDGVYTVQSDYLPMLNVGTHSATVSAAEYIGGQLNTAPSVTFSIDVADAPLTTQSQNISLYAGVSWTGTVATFTDADACAQAGNYTATLTDGAGTTSAGTIFSDGNGGFYVTGTLAYATPGYYAPEVTITDNGGSTATVDDLAAVNAAPLSLSAWNIHIAAGQSYTGIVGILTDSAGSNSDSSNYSADLNWNGADYTNLTFAADGPGQWAVMATGLTGLSSGAFGGSLSVSETIGSQTVTADNASFSIFAAYGQGTSINTTVGSGWYGTIATITNPDSSDSPANYTASTLYGDSSNGTATSPSTGNIQQGSGNWAVTDTHTFTATGTYSPVTTVTSTTTGILLATASSTATVNLASISLSVSSAFLQEGQSLSGDIGTLADSAGTYATGSYTGSVTFAGDPSNTAYPVTFMADGNNDGGYSVQASGMPPLAAGWHDATLSVSEYDSGLNQTVNATSAFSIYAAAAPLTAASDTPTTVSAVEGQTISGILLHFTNGNPYAQAGDHTVLVDWGDSTSDSSTSSSNVSIAADSSGGFDVIGTHTFALSGTYTISLTVQDNATSTLNASLSAGIADAALTASSDSISTISMNQGATFSGSVLHFTDANPLAQTGNYSATIDWGDGNTSSTAYGTITLTSDGQGGFNVNNTHSYSTSGAYTVSVTVTEIGGSQVTNSIAANIAPGAPASLAATAIGCGEIDLTWTNSDNSVNIEVARSTSSGGTFSTVTTLSPGSTSYQDTGLDSGTTYYYQVRAVQSGVYSDYSNAASATTM